MSGNLKSTAGVTRRAAEFMKANATASVVMAQWLDKDRRPVTGTLETWVKLRVRFDTGKQMTMNEPDLASLKATGFQMVWYGDRHPAAAREQVA